MKKSAAPPNRVFVLDEPEKFANRARKAFATVIDKSVATLTKLPQPRSEVALILRGAGGETVSGEQVALPFATGIKGVYWLSAKLVLTPVDDKYALKSISLSVFRGEARTEKVALIRAEWDCPVCIVNNHAQPHWHAYPDIFNRSGDNVSLDNLQSKTTVFELPTAEVVSYQDTEPEAAGFTHVHLAMAATWHLPKGSQDRIEMTSEAEAFAWIENCTSYLKNQLIALC